MIQHGVRSICANWFKKRLLDGCSTVLSGGDWMDGNPRAGFLLSHELLLCIKM